jgi:hypothetical protein
MRWRWASRLVEAAARGDRFGPALLKEAEIYGAVTLGGLILALVAARWLIE